MPASGVGKAHIILLILVLTGCASSRPLNCRPPGMVAVPSGRPVEACIEKWFGCSRLHLTWLDTGEKVVTAWSCGR